MKIKFLVSTAVVFVATMLESFIVHGVTLYGSYTQLPGLFRSEAESQHYFKFIIVAHSIMAAAMVWIYRQGKLPNKHYVGQGLRFGLCIALVGVIPLHLIHYAVQPLPALLVAKQTVFDALGFILIGMIVARMEN